MKSLQSSIKSMFMAARDLKQRLITTLDSLGIDPSADEFPVEELQNKIKAGLQENLSLAKMNMAAKAREIWDRTVPSGCKDFKEINSHMNKVFFLFSSLALITYA